MDVVLESLKKKRKRENKEVHTMITGGHNPRGSEESETTTLNKDLNDGQQHQKVDH